MFQVELVFPPDFPDAPPYVHFLTSMFHPHISPLGVPYLRHLIMWNHLEPKEKSVSSLLTVLELWKLKLEVLGFLAPNREPPAPVVSALASGDHTQHTGFTIRGDSRFRSLHMFACVRAYMALSAQDTYPQAEPV